MESNRHNRSESAIQQQLGHPINFGNLFLPFPAYLSHSSLPQFVSIDDAPICVVVQRGCGVHESRWKRIGTLIIWKIKDCQNWREECKRGSLKYGKPEKLFKLFCSRKIGKNNNLCLSETVFQLA